MTTKRVDYMQQSPELTKKFLEFSLQLAKASIELTKPGAAAPAVRADPGAVPGIGIGAAHG